MLESQKTGGYNGGPIHNSSSRLELASTDRAPKEEAPLSEKVEQLGYAINRIETKVEQIQYILFGAGGPKEGNDCSISSIDDAVEGIRGKAGSIDYTLDQILRRLTGE